MKLKQELTRLQAMHQELLDLARATVGALQGGNLEALDDVWAKRRVCFKRLTALRKKLEPPLAAWNKKLAALEPKEADSCRNLLSSVKQKGLKVLELDKQAAGLLNAARDDLRKKLERLGEGQRLLKAYGQPPKPLTARRISKTG